MRKLFTLFLTGTFALSTILAPCTAFGLSGTGLPITAEDILVQDDTPSKVVATPSTTADASVDTVESVDAADLVDPSLSTPAEGIEENEGTLDIQSAEGYDAAQTCRLLVYVNFPVGYDIPYTELGPYSVGTTITMPTAIDILGANLGRDGMARRNARIKGWTVGNSPAVYKCGERYTIRQSGKVRMDAVWEYAKDYTIKIYAPKNMWLACKLKITKGGSWELLYTQTYRNRYPGQYMTLPYFIDCDVREDNSNYKLGYAGYAKWFNVYYWPDKELRYRYESMVSQNTTGMPNSLWYAFVVMERMPSTLYAYAHIAVEKMGNTAFPLKQEYDPMSPNITKFI